MEEKKISDFLQPANKISLKQKKLTFKKSDFLHGYTWVCINV